MKLNALLDENRFILSPDRPDTAFTLPPLIFGDTEPVTLRGFTRGMNGLVAVDPASYEVNLVVGTPNARPTLGFWWLTTTAGDSMPIASRASAEDVASALVFAFGPVTVEGDEGEYIVTVTNPGVWATPTPSYTGSSVSGVEVFENTPGTATTSAQYRITVQEAAPASIATDAWSAGTQPVSTFAQVSGRLWQLNLGTPVDGGFFTLTIDGVTTEFIPVTAGGYQIETVLSVAGKPAQVQSDGVGGFYVMFAEDVTAASVGGHVVAFPYSTGQLALNSPALRELLDGQQFSPVTLSVSFAEGEQSSTCSANALLQMPIGASVSSQPPTPGVAGQTMRTLPTVTGYTGGGSANLDGVPTSGLSVPALYMFVSATDGGCIYRLRSGTDAANVPQIIRPLDYSATNEKVWEAVSITFFGGTP